MTVEALPVGTVWSILRDFSHNFCVPIDMLMAQSCCRATFPRYKTSRQFNFRRRSASTSSTWKPSFLWHTSLKVIISSAHVYIGCIEEWTCARKIFPHDAVSGVLPMPISPLHSGLTNPTTGGLRTQELEELFVQVFGGTIVEPRSMGAAVPSAMPAVFETNISAGGYFVPNVSVVSSSFSCVPFFQVASSSLSSSSFRLCTSGMVFFLLWSVLVPSACCPHSSSCHDVLL